MAPIMTQTKEQKKEYDKKRYPKIKEQRKEYYLKNRAYIQSRQKKYDLKSLLIEIYKMMICVEVDFF